MQSSRGGDGSFPTSRESALLLGSRSGSATSSCKGSQMLWRVGALFYLRMAPSLEKGGHSVDRSFFLLRYNVRSIGEPGEVHI